MKIFDGHADIWFDVASKKKKGVRKHSKKLSL